MPRRLVMLAIAVAGVLLWGEAMEWRASGRRLGDDPGPGEREVVVVLGYRNRGARANLINRHRVRAGLRSRTPGSRSVVVFSGGPVGGPVAEAELLAQYARSLDASAAFVTETASRSTWENIANVIGFLEDADRIKIVSNALHAEKGRLYLAKQRPDLAKKLVRSAEYRFGELIGLKPIIAVMGLADLARLRRGRPGHRRP